MTKLTGSKVKLTIGGEEVQGFTEDEMSVKLQRKFGLKCPTSTNYLAPTEHSLRLWATQIVSMFSLTIHMTWTKPTKRQLRKWKRKVRKLNH